jgi:hypothetical protein
LWFVVNSSPQFFCLPFLAFSCFSMQIVDNYYARLCSQLISRAKPFFPFIWIRNWSCWHLIHNKSTRRFIGSCTLTPAGTVTYGFQEYRSCTPARYENLTQETRFSDNSDSY